MSNSIDDPLIGCITQFHPHKYTYMRYHVAAKRLAERCSSLGSFASVHPDLPFPEAILGISFGTSVPCQGLLVGGLGRKLSVSVKKRRMP